MATITLYELGNYNNGHLMLFLTLIRISPAVLEKTISPVNPV